MQTLAEIISSLYGYLTALATFLTISAAADNIGTKEDKTRAAYYILRTQGVKFEEFENKLTNIYNFKQKAS